MHLKSYLLPAALVLMLAIIATTPASRLKAGYFGSNHDKLKKDIKSKTETFDYSLVIKDLKGNKVTMDQFKGKVIFLNEWATWCGPCRAEMPSIQKLYDVVDKDNIVFVMLSRDQPEDTPKITRYISAKAFTFPVYQPISDLPKQLDSPSIPSTWVIAKDGKIVKKEVGIINASEIKSLLESEAKK